MFDKYLVPLFVLYSMDGKVRGRTRFQKLVFLSKQKLKEDGKNIRINFTRLHYGPFSRDLQESLESHAEEGTINEVVEESTFGLVYVYSLTDRGVEIVKDSIRKRIIPKIVQKSINEITSEFGNMSLDELISKVYTEYPEYNPNICY